METRNQTADYLPWSEFKRLVNSLYKDEKYQYCLIVVIGVYFGLRISDIKRIRWEDILNSDKIIMKEKKTRKTNKRREIPVSENLREFVFDIYQRTRPKSKFIVTISASRGGTNSINETFKRFKERYNLQINNFTTHSLRKTFGRRYLETHNYSARAILMLNDIFNHSSLSDTKRYFGITKEEINEVYSQVGEKVL